MNKTSLLILLLISGCATQWKHETASELDFNKDHFECAIESERAYSVRTAPARGSSGYDRDYQRGEDVGNNIVRNLNISRYYNMCMNARGYTK